MSSWKGMGALVVALTFLGCGRGEDRAKEDKVKQAVRGTVRKEFDYYEGAKQRLGEAEKQEQQKREQEKELE